MKFHLLIAMLMLSASAAVADNSQLGHTDVNDNRNGSNCEQAEGPFSLTADNVLVNKKIEQEAVEVLTPSQKMVARNFKFQRLINTYGLGPAISTEPYVKDIQPTAKQIEEINSIAIEAKNDLAKWPNQHFVKKR